MGKPYFAFCWSSGLIQFGDQVPAGAIECCRGARTTVVREVTAKARHSSQGSNRVLLVPGVPEASGQRLKCDALGVWLAWCGGSCASRFITWSHIDSFGKFRDPAEVDRVAKALLASMLRQVNRKASTGATVGRKA